MQINLYNELHRIIFKMNRIEIAITAMLQSCDVFKLPYSINQMQFEATLLKYLC